MDLNRVVLVGYVGDHLESRKLDNGSKRVSLRVHTHHRFSNDQGEIKEATTWHRIVAWGAQADLAEGSFVKGSHIMVEGKIEHRTFTGSEGNKVKFTRIVATCLTNLDR